ncbi:GAF domain-containing protein [Pokkaliibacter sp. MBI-7]|uniref:GAF domain-containing protein n=1 Tax=Pokkaliibacter sp. MBI-7 TaxID=3040600 RepID=UPI00244D6B6F|nr:GAF domain-containing protein [Pokkaliibacter sp. MBI-7]MDH2434924.1 GAF domain-containing protein [Pokkaliibacter sp. MBI-7]
MYTLNADVSQPKAEMYADLLPQCRGLLSDSRDMIVNLSQFSALLFNLLPDLNWAGFYLAAAPETLILGPFQGKIACVTIPFSKGVCGAAARTREIQCIADVHAFPGHIACDAASRSELVIPLYLEDRLIGVLDLDSPSPDRFDEEDVKGINALCQCLITQTDWKWQFQA